MIFNKKSSNIYTYKLLLIVIETLKKRVIKNNPRY